MRMSIEQIGGVPTRLLWGGEGPALIIAHPIGFSADAFARVIERLSERHLVIAFDLLGQGWTGRRLDAETPPQIADARHMIGVADQFGLDHFSACGSSYGGLVAGLAYFEAPKRVRKLVMIGSGSAFNPPDTLPAVYTSVLENGVSAFDGIATDTSIRRIRNITVQEFPLDWLVHAQLIQYCQSDIKDSYVEIVSAVRDSITDPRNNIFSRLEEITIPVLSICGSQDIRTNIANQKSAVARLRHGRLAEYDRCGHLPFLEREDDFLLDISRHLVN